MSGWGVGAEAAVRDVEQPPIEAAQGGEVEGCVRRFRVPSLDRQADDGSKGRKHARETSDRSQKGGRTNPICIAHLGPMPRRTLPQTLPTGPLETYAYVGSTKVSGQKGDPA